MWVVKLPPRVRRLRVDVLLKRRSIRTHCKLLRWRHRGTNRILLRRGLILWRHHWAHLRGRGSLFGRFFNRWQVDSLCFSFLFLCFCGFLFWIGSLVGSGLLCSFLLPRRLGVLEDVFLLQFEFGDLLGLLVELHLQSLLLVFVFQMFQLLVAFRMSLVLRVVRVGHGFLVLALRRLRLLFLLSQLVESDFSLCRVVDVYDGFVCSERSNFVGIHRSGCHGVMNGACMSRRHRQLAVHELFVPLHVRRNGQDALFRVFWLCIVEAVDHFDVVRVHFLRQLCGGSCLRAEVVVLAQTRCFEHVRLLHATNHLRLF